MLGAFVAWLVGSGAGYTIARISGVKAIGILGKSVGWGMSAKKAGSILGGFAGSRLYRRLRERD